MRAAFAVHRGEHHCFLPVSWRAIYSSTSLPRQLFKQRMSEAMSPAPNSPFGVSPSCTRLGFGPPFHSLGPKGLGCGSGGGAGGAAPGARTPRSRGPLRLRDRTAPAAPHRAGRVPPLLRGGEPACGNQHGRRWLWKLASSRPGAVGPGTAQGGKTWRGHWHGPPGTLGFCPFAKHQPPLGSGRDRVIGGEFSPPVPP